MPPHRTRVPRWAMAGLIVVAVILASLWIAAVPLSRIARGRILDTLKQRFGDDLELRSLSVVLFPRVRIEGAGAVFHFKGRTDLPPLITIRKFTGTTSLLGLLRRHVSRLNLEGLQIRIPPKSERPHQEKKPGHEAGYFVIDQLQADGTTLVISPKNAEKQPLEWDIEKLTLYGEGPSTTATFQAVLTNAKPPGEIHSTGQFGPWDQDEPGDTQVSGNYTFQNADVGVFKGIAGTLSSEGSYRGVLGRIETDGHTDTPDFMVKVSGNPVHLTTQFHAIVDGTDGNTWLQPVTAQFGHSTVIAQGGVAGNKGEGKTVSLDATVTDGRLEDMMRIGVKGKPGMSGAISFHTKIVIPPGDVDIAQKLQLDGSFAAGATHFSKLNVQEKVNDLSHRGKGEPEEPDTDTVASNFTGHFSLDRGLMTLRNLSFQVPGVEVSLNGKYGMLDQKIDFHGTAKLDAQLSETTTGWKSFLLKAIDPIFRKKNAGAVLPIKIGGTRDQPSFGLDIHGGA
ncbi:MAG TPA: hypothetical protein VGN17_13665 [Bryobacteraceae bacterium]